jgi:hypothetical protein
MESFLQKNCNKVSGATFLGVAVSIFAFFSIPFAHAASVVYGQPPADTQTGTLKSQYFRAGYGKPLSIEMYFYNYSDGEEGLWRVDNLVYCQPEYWLSEGDEVGENGRCDPDHYILIDLQSYNLSAETTAEDVCTPTVFDLTPVLDVLPVFTGDEYFTFGIGDVPGQDNTVRACVTQDDQITYSRFSASPSIDVDLVYSVFFDSSDQLYVNFLGDYYNTKFTSVDITASSSVVSFDVDYFLDSDEINASSSATNPTLVRVSFASSTQNDVTSYGISIDNSQTGSQSVQFDLPQSLSDGVYDYIIDFSNSGCTLGLSSCPFPNAYITGQFTLSAGILTSYTESVYTDETFYSWDNPETMYKECGLSNMAGCIQNAFIFLFIPNSTQIGSDITDIILDETIPLASQKFPFRYVADLKVVYQEQVGLQSTTTVPSVSYDLTGTVIPSEFDLFSQDSMSQIAGKDFLSLVKSIISSFLLLSFIAYVIFRTVRVSRAMGTSS